MGINTATNINEAVGCGNCARRETCQRERPLLALLVFLKAGGKCEAREVQG